MVTISKGIDADSVMIVITVTAANQLMISNTLTLTMKELFLGTEPIRN